MVRLCAVDEPRRRTTLYRGGAVYSPADPSAQAVLTVGDAVAWMGSDDAARAHADSADEVVELDGGLVTPAFVDAHAHVTETGLALTGVDLTDTRSVADALDQVARAAATGDGPVLGHGWDEQHWPEQRPPTLAELDRASGGRPVYLARVDVHSGVVSSALAERLGLDTLVGWSADGRVERAAHAAARGLTREGIAPDRRRELQRAALRAAAAAGIGTLHEMSAPHIAPLADLLELVALTGSEPLPQVVAYRGTLVADTIELDQVVAELPTGLAGLAGDLCADGSVGSRTCGLREPYVDADPLADADGVRGHVYLDADQVRDHFVACTRAGIQGGMHVIGDAALDVVLAGLAAAEDVVGLPALRRARHRLEHVELVDAAAVEQLTHLAITASVQPSFDAAWGGPDGMYAKRLGRGRARAMIPLASLVRAGVPLALGSDSPVTPFDPWGWVAAAVGHTNPEQRISARAAFTAATRGGHRAAGHDSLGVLAPGSPATLAVWDVVDLVVQAPDGRVSAWSTDPRSRTPGLPDLSNGPTRPTCLRTVVDGVVVHRAQASATGQIG
jgi:predicted amidohydrolase YtcJ